MKRWVWVGACLVVGCALGTVATKKRSLPKTRGELTVKGTTESIEVLRDEYGVPHIRAAREQDAWFAVGFVHAQDRLFQMDFSRRVTYGRLSEWTGESYADADLFMKGIQLRRRASEALAALRPEERKVLDAYTAGVNAGAESLKSLPVEYRLLEVGYEPWTPEDSLALAFLNSWALAANPSVEFLALSLRKKLDAAGLDALLRIDPESPPVESYWDTLRTAEFGPFNASMVGFLRLMGLPYKPAASNNWVVGPSRSLDGAPLLANDPHLTQRVPSLWYVVDVQGGPVHVAGATFPGSPFVLSGHNEQLAWGVTNTMADYVDVAIVERRGERGYLLAGEEKELTSISVDIDIKGKPSVKREQPWTEIGPVISELTGTHLLVLRWHAFEVVDESGLLFYQLNRARSVEEGLAALSRPSILSQNVVLADREGDYAWQVFGSVPNRRGFSGRVPYPASDPAYAWDGFLASLPGERAPERGYVATANHKPGVPSADAISTDFAPRWRFSRIGELLDKATRATPEELGRIQRDHLNLHAKERLPALLRGVSPASGEAKRCAELLQSWDFVMSPESAGAAAWVLFQRELLREALLDDLGEEGLRDYLRTVGDGGSLLDGQLSRFLPDQAAGVERALTATCKALHARLGDKPERWSWGALHPLELEHPFASQSKFLRGWSMKPVPYGGSLSTVNPAGYSWGDEDYSTSFMASIRVVTPLSDVGKATFIYPGGQSGQPGSPHYRDLYDVYTSGGTVPLFFSEGDVKEHTKDRLLLTPPALP